MQPNTPDSPDSAHAASPGTPPDWWSLLPEGVRRTPSDGPPGEDLDLLVPLEPGWQLLDLTGDLGERAEALVRRGAGATVSVPDAALVPAVEARGRAAGFTPEQWRVVVCDPTKSLEPSLGRFPLVLAAGQSYISPPSVRGMEAPFGKPIGASSSRPGLSALRSLIRPGGYLVWRIEGASLPQPALNSLPGLLNTARAAAEWARAKAEGPNLWRVQLTRSGFEETQLYVQVREYTWGFLPFDAYWLQRYYLETLQEEGQGTHRGKAQLARLLGQGGAYPFLASAHILTARTPEELV